MDKYTALNKVGEGTYGTVIKCVEESTGLLVAMKRLRNSMNRDRRHSEMIVREISLLRMLNNDHVVPMIDVFRYGGHVYMVFPYMRCNLYSYMELNGGALTVDRTRECMYQVLKGLNYVHGRNVVHRDVKPENVLLSPTGVIKICDFGVSRLFCPDDTLNLSAEVGTLWYQAPEMLMAKKNYDTSVDIWSIGVLFTELVNQLPLVTENTVVGQLYGIVRVLHTSEDDLAVVAKYLRRHHGVALNLDSKTGRRASQSRSYVVSNTALVLGKMFTRWPTHLLELVANCLQFDPTNRKNASQLLDMKFFTGNSFVPRFDQELKVKLKSDER